MLNADADEHARRDAEHDDGRRLALEGFARLRDERRQLLTEREALVDDWLAGHDFGGAS